MNDNFNIDTLPITEAISENYTHIIDLLGENATREGLLKTPWSTGESTKIVVIISSIWNN